MGPTSGLILATFGTAVDAALYHSICHALSYNLESSSSLLRDSAKIDGRIRQMLMIKKFSKSLALGRLLNEAGSANRRCPRITRTNGAANCRRAPMVPAWV